MSGASKMGEKAIKRLEYEEQIFGLNSQFLTDSFINFMGDELHSLTDQLVKDFTKKLIRESKNPDAFKKKAEEMRMSLKKEYKKSLEMETSEIKEQISKYMDIPDHVLLKEDLPIKQHKACDVKETEREVNELKGKYKALRYLKSRIHNEIKVADSLTFIVDNIIATNDIDFKILNTDELLSLAKTNLALVK